MKPCPVFHIFYNKTNFIPKIHSWEEKERKEIITNWNEIDCQLFGTWLKNNLMKAEPNAESKVQSLIFFRCTIVRSYDSMYYSTTEFRPFYRSFNQQWQQSWPLAIGWKLHTERESEVSLYDCTMVRRKETKWSRL